MVGLRGYKADLVYGGSGLYKTSNIGRCAERWHTKWQKRTRLVTADPGGWEPIQSLVDAGIVEAWPIALWPNRIESLDLACQGYWPKDVRDPSKGLDPPSNVLKEVGFYAFEGLTSFGSHVMTTLKQPNVTLSQDPSYVLSDGKTKYAGGSMAAYGFVQDRIHDFVTKSHMIPLVDRVLWTALEGKGEEEGTRIPVFGPAIEGRKSIGKAGQWFGNMIHFEAVAEEFTPDKETKQLSIRTRVWAYLKPHADPTSKIVFPAWVRAPYQFPIDVPERIEP